MTNNPLIQSLEKTIVQTNSRNDAVFDFYGYFYGEGVDWNKIYPNVIEHYLSSIKNN